MASSAELFQSVTTSALAGMPMVDARFIAPAHAMKSELLKAMLTEPPPLTNQGLIGLHRFLCQAYSFPSMRTPVTTSAMIFWTLAVEILDQVLRDLLRP